MNGNGGLSYRPRGADLVPKISGACFEIICQGNDGGHGGQRMGEVGTDLWCDVCGWLVLMCVQGQAAILSGPLPWNRGTQQRVQLTHTQQSEGPVTMMREGTRAAMRDIKV